MSIIFENSELTGSGIKSVIPDYVMSFSEAALFVAEASSVDYNNLMESIGVEELAVYESTGMEIVYEGERLDNFKEKIVNFFKKIWESIKEFFEKILNWFEEKRKEVVKKMGAKINAADLKNLPENTVFGRMHDYGNFKDEADKIEKNTDSFVKDVCSKFEDVCRGVNETDKESKSKALQDGDRLKEELSGKVVKEISGTSATSIDEAKKALEKKLIGTEFEVNKNNIGKYLPGLLEITTAGKVNSSIKTLYKSNKKMIDDAIGRARKYTDSRAICAGKEVFVYREIMTCSTALTGKIMDIYKKLFTESRSVLVKVYFKAGKIKKVNESFYGSIVDDQINLVESILNF